MATLQVLAAYTSHILGSGYEWIGYLSSTAVYGDHLGEEVTEECDATYSAELSILPSFLQG